ncbi:hypothetical protein KHP57_04750 [Algiphilus sp. NNCM1]|nr:hypothetical protein [Algiphilus acroporae]
MPFSQWFTTLDDVSTATAAPGDHLLDPSHIAQISGESCRLKDEREAGHVQRSVAKTIE